MPKGKAKHGKSILYVKAASLNDICRYAYNFDFASSSLVMSGGDSRLIALGESIEETTIAYYVNAPANSKFINYNFPSSRAENEISSFADSINESSKNYLYILNLDLSHLSPAKSIGKDKVTMIRAGSPEDIINSAIKKAVKLESFMHIYSFEYKGKRYICAFDLIEELVDEKKTFYYAALKDKSTAGFAKYRYSDNTFEFTDTVEEHSYIYVKIINLAEPFSFFKPD